LPELQFGDNTANLLREYKGTDGSIPSFTFTFPNERDRYILWFFKMQPGSHGYQRLGCIMNLSRKTKIGYLNYNGYIEQKVAREAGKLQLFANPNDLQKLSFGVSEGRCIYCNQELKDPISLMAGYGKDCAEANFVPYF
jgi:hypothetical protein